VGELLSLRIEANAQRTTVRVGGDLDLATAPALRDCLVGVVGDVVVDLTAVTFVDSSALAVLIGEHKRRVAAGEQLTITGSSPMALRVFEATGLDRLLDLNGDSSRH
jgi:anti-sigma B factor antagonist